MGVFEIDLPDSASEYFNDVVVRPNGKIVAVGAVTGSTNRELLLMFFNADGSPDEEQYPDGRIQIPLGGRADLLAAIVDEDGSVMAAGCVEDVLGQLCCRAARQAWRTRK